MLLTRVHIHIHTQIRRSILSSLQIFKRSAPTQTTTSTCHLSDSEECTLVGGDRWMIPHNPPICPHTDDTDSNTLREEEGQGAMFMARTAY